MTSFGFLFTDSLLLAIQQLGPREHRLRRVPVQADDAEQSEAGASRLRGREPGQAAENVQSEVGVHLHAGGGAVQG